MWDVQHGNRVSLVTYVRTSSSNRKPVFIIYGRKHIADKILRICALTIYRIKVTSDIDPANGETQSGLITLTTCLELLLGVINACLPVIKPIFNKFANFLHLPSLSTWRSGTRSRKRTATSGNGSWDERRRPKISSPRRISIRPSHLIFERDGKGNFRGLSPPLLSISPVSRFDIPGDACNEKQGERDIWDSEIGEPNMGKRKGNVKDMIIELSPRTNRYDMEKAFRRDAGRWSDYEGRAI